MPFIPPSFFSLDSYLVQDPAQSAFNVSLPSIDIPEMPSLPSGDTTINFFLTLWKAITGFFSQVPANAEKFVKEHPEEANIGVVVVLVVVAAIALHLVLPLLVSVLTAIFSGLVSVFKAAMMGNLRRLPMREETAIQQLFLLVAAGVLHLVGFTAQGVAAGSVAAGVQSVIYGPLTTGLFSMLQSLGMVIGRLAGAAVAVV